MCEADEGWKERLMSQNILATVLSAVISKVNRILEGENNESSLKTATR